MRANWTFAKAQIAAVLALGLASAATTVLGQPQGVVSGYVIDGRTGSLRAVLGIPGATRLGDPIALPSRIQSGAIRSGRAVLLSQGLAQSVYVARNLSAAAPEVIALNAAIPHVSRVFMNPIGTTALLYSLTAHRFQFVTGLDTTPHAGDPISDSMVQGAFAAASVASSTGCALVASNDEAGAYLRKLCPDGSSPITVGMTGAHISSLAWFRKDVDAVAVDQNSNQVYRLSDVSNGGSPVALAGPAQGIGFPAEVLPLDDSHVALTERGSATLRVFDTNGGTSQSYTLTQVPTELDAMDEPGVLAISRIGPGPLLLVDTRHNFASFFVPLN